MSMLKEFKEFAMKGNLIDIAVGFVMGAAFGKVTGAFISGIVMPFVGLIQGKDLSQWQWELKKASLAPDGKEIPAVVVTYGQFIGFIIEFIIIAFVMFLVVKAVNKMKKAEVPAPPAGPSTEEVLLTEIRDLLKK